jgi:hypothetical protein
MAAIMFIIGAAYLILYCCGGNEARLIYETKESKEKKELK